MRPKGPDHIAPVPNRIFAADQRSSFYRDYIGVDIKQRKPRLGEKLLSRRMKRNVIGDGFELAAKSGLVKADTNPDLNAIPGILIDEDLGGRVISRNIAAGRSVGIPVEVSGNVFNFELEYGEEFRAHIQKFERDGNRPAFVKALIQYNPDMPADLREDMFEKMRKVAEFSQQHGYPIMAEVLIKATDKQLEDTGGKDEDERKALFDTQVRPGLEVQMIADFNAAQIPVDVWKIEGMNKVEEYNAVLEEAAKGEKDPKVIVLGRNATDDQLKTWLTAAAQAEIEVDGVKKRIFGFAIGRSIWGELIKRVLKETRRDEEHRNLRRDFRHNFGAAVGENILQFAFRATGTNRRAERQAAEEASKRYLMFNDMFTTARSEHLQAQADAITISDAPAPVN